MAGKLRAAKGFWPCYEASPTGYVRYWQRTHFGVDAGGVASGSSESRHRVRTGPADAEKLARWYMAGDVTPAWVSDEAHEALCDVVRAREAAKNDRDRTRH